MVSNQEDLTTPIEDISPKQRYGFFFIENATKGSTKSLLPQFGNSLQCEFFRQKRQAKFVRSEMN